MSARRPSPSPSPGSVSAAPACARPAHLPGKCLHLPGPQLAFCAAFGCSVVAFGCTLVPCVAAACAVPASPPFPPAAFVCAAPPPGLACAASAVFAVTAFLAAARRPRGRPSQPCLPASGVQRSASAAPRRPVPWGGPASPQPSPLLLCRSWRPRRLAAASAAAVLRPDAPALEDSSTRQRYATAVMPARDRLIAPRDVTSAVRDHAC